jgi:hypothetical protein
MAASVSAEEAYYVVLRTVVAGKQANWVSVPLSATATACCARVKHEKMYSCAHCCTRTLLSLCQRCLGPHMFLDVADCHGAYAAVAALDGGVR